MTGPSRGGDLESQFATMAVPSEAVEVRRVRSEARRRLFGARGDPVTIDRFEIRRRLGSGAMGIVYLAHDPELDRELAVKLLHRTDPKTQQRAGQRLRREAQAMAQLSHPNVAAIHKVGEDGGRLYIAMEFVPGRTLSRWLAESRPWRDIVGMFVQVAHGLAAAHAAGIVHRDFKPDNVIVGDDGRARVLDFGLAAAVGDARTQVTAEGPDGERQLEPERLTQTGVAVGTPAFMAPEQHAGRPADPRADQFSFSVALFQALYGQPPYRGDSVEEVRASIARGPVARRPPDKRVPARVHRVVIRGLHAHPDRRFGSMDELVRQLAAARMPTSAWQWAIVVGAIAIVGYAFVVADSEAPACDADAAWGQTWNPTRAASTRAALLGTGAPKADQAVARVESGLGAYADDWRDEYRRACTDAPTPDRDHEMACLRSGRRDFDALVEVLADPSPQMVMRAASAVSGLPPPAACRRAGGQWAEDESDALPDNLEAIATRISRSRAEALAGNYERAREIAAEVAYASEGLDTRLHAQALLQLGAAQELAGHYDDAERSDTQAFWTGQSAGDDETAARAANHLVYLLGVRQRKTEPAMTWARHAQALAKRGGADPLVTALTHQHTGSVHLLAGEFDQASVEYETALELKQEILGPDHPDVGAVWNNLGGLHYQLGELDRARDEYRRTLAIWEAALGSDHPDVASCLANLGAVEAGAGDPEQARGFLLRALEIRQRVLEPGHPKIADTHHNLGLALQRLGEYDEAAAHHQTALESLTASLGRDHPTLATSYAALGNLANRRGDPEGTRTFHGRAVELLTRAHGRDHPEVARSLARIGESYLTEGDLSAAEDHFQRALAIWLPLVGTGHPDVVTGRTALAATWTAQGRREDACQMLRRALTDGQAGGATETVLDQPREALVDCPRWDKIE